jgi:hypothetical protein
LKAARQAFSTANISQSDKDALKSQWNTTLQTYQSCNLDARREIVSVRIEHLQANIDDWNAIIANMTAKGMDTTEMTAVVADAQKLLTDLNASIQAADDATFKTMLDNANDEQNHVWARFSIGRMKANIAHIEPLINQANLSVDDLNKIQSLLNSASVLATPGSKFGVGGFQQTWQDIKVANDMLGSVSKNLRTFEQTRQRGRFGNNTNPRNFTNFTRGNMTRPPRDFNNFTRGNMTRPPRRDLNGTRSPTWQDNRSAQGGNLLGQSDNNTQGGAQ